MRNVRASIRQVAEIAQVSPMTVTRVLNGHALVSEETRTRVLDAVRQVNYIPVRTARQNRHVVTNILGVVPCHVDPMRKRLDSETYAGICDGARRHGYDLLVMLRRESEWMAERQEIRFLDRRSDGFIFLSTGEGEWSETLEKLVAHEIPTVVCYRRDVPAGIAWVDPDNEATMQAAVGALVAAGHRTLAYLPTPGYDHIQAGQLADKPKVSENFDDHMRLKEFTKVALANNCEAVLLPNKNRNWSIDVSIIECIRESGATGVVCVNDLLALELWRAAEKAGLRVPEDLSITGVDNSPDAEVHGLTSVGFGYDEVGCLAVDVWLELVKGTPADVASRVAPVTLFARRSIGPPRS